MADLEINIVTAPLTLSQEQKSSSVDLSPAPLVSVDEVSDETTTSVDTIKMTSEIDIKSKTITLNEGDRKRTVGVVTKPIVLSNPRATATATASGSDKKTRINITGYGAMASKAYLSNVHGRVASDEFLTADIIMFDLGSTLLDEAGTTTYIEFDLLSHRWDEITPDDANIRFNLVTHRFEIGYAVDSGFHMSLDSNLATIAPMLDTIAYDWNHELPADVGVLLADISFALDKVLSGTDTATLSDVCEAVFTLLWNAFDTATVVESANSALDRGIVDTIIVSEAYVKTFERIYGNDDAVASEFIVNAFDKGIIDLIAAIEVLENAVDYIRESEDTASAESLLATLIDKGFFDFVTAYENFSTAAEFPRTASETTTLTDTYGRNFDWVLGEDVYTITDLIIAGLTFVRSASDSAIVSEGMAILMDREVLEAAYASVSMSIVGDFLRDFVETSTVSEVLAFAQALELYEIVNSSETLLTEVTFLRELVDAVSPTDTYFMAVGLNMSESLALTTTYTVEIITQDYALEDYFAEDYATVG